MKNRIKRLPFDLEVISILFALCIFPVQVYANELDVELQFSEEEKKYLESAEYLTPYIVNSSLPAKDLLFNLVEQEIKNSSKSEGCQGSQLHSVGTLRYALLDSAIADNIIKNNSKSAWYVNADMTHCNEQRNARFVITQNANDTYSASMVLPGQTSAWLSLVGDLMTGLRSVALIVSDHPDAICEGEGARFRLIDTQIRDAGTRGPYIFGVRYEGSWQETWIFENCKLVAEAPVNFRADGKGGAFYSIAQDDVVITKGKNWNR